MYWVDNNNLTIPIIPCIGNHEIYGDSNAVSYLGQFSLPESEKWYSLDWGPNLHITVLDTETDMSGAQRDWLQDDWPNMRITYGRWCSFMSRLSAMVAMASICQFGGTGSPYSMIITLTWLSPATIISTSERIR